MLINMDVCLYLPFGLSNVNTTEANQIVLLAHIRPSFRSVPRVHLYFRTISYLYIEPKDLNQMCIAQEGRRLCTCILIAVILKLDSLVHIIQKVVF